MKVEKIKENKDGSATVSVLMNMKEEALFRKLAKEKKQRYSQAFVRRELLSALTASFEKEKNKKNG